MAHRTSVGEGGGGEVTNILIYLKASLYVIFVDGANFTFSTLYFWKTMYDFWDGYIKKN